MTAAGAATLNGNVTLGNASSDDVTITGSLASTINIKTTNSYNIGSATLGLAGAYFGNSGGSTTIRIISASSVSSSRTYTLPDAGGSADFVMNAGAQSIAGVKTFTSGISFGDETLSSYDEFTVSSASISNANWTGTYNLKAIRVGNLVTVTVKTSSASGTTYTADVNTSNELPSGMRPTSTMWSMGALALGGQDMMTMSVDSSGVVTFTKTAYTAAGGMVSQNFDSADDIAMTMSYSLGI